MMTHIREELLQSAARDQESAAYYACEARYNVELGFHGAARRDQDDANFYAWASRVNLFRALNAIELDDRTADV